MNFSDILSDYTPYRELTESLDNTPVSVAGITETAQGHIISTLRNRENTNALVITYSETEARALTEDLRLYFDCVFHFPERDNILYNIETTDRSRSNTRMSILSHLVSEGKAIVIISVNALMQYCAAKDRFKEFNRMLKKGECYDISELSKILNVMGYVSEDMVEGVGQYSIRGEILDIFSPNYDNPVRIDFFDNEIETIRLFDPLTQRSVESLDEVSIISANEAIMPNDVQVNIIKKLSKELSKVKSENFKSAIESDIESFKERYYFPSIDRYAKEIYGYIPNILDYFSDKDLVFVCDPKRIFERMKRLEEEWGEAVTGL